MILLFLSSTLTVLTATLFSLLIFPQRWLDPPKITKPNSSAIEAEHSESVTVECLAEANPPASYVWTNAAGEIETHGRYLSVQNVEDLDGRNYTFTCTATNILGFDNHSVFITITSRFFFSILKY